MASGGRRPAGARRSVDARGHAAGPPPKREVLVQVDGPEAILAALDPEQREVALASRGPVCVTAGAGTGKTRAIAHRIGYAAATGVMQPGHVLAVTFTTRAAGELRARLRLLSGAAAGLEAVTAR